MPFKDFIESIRSGREYLEQEASYNDIDISELNHDSDYNSKSIIINTEKNLDDLNKEFFETLNDFKVNYVNYYLDRYTHYMNAPEQMQNNQIHAMLGLDFYL